MKNFEAVVHKGSWAVFNKRDCSFELVDSKKIATIKANELNALDRKERKEIK